MKNILVDSETVRLWLVDHSYERAITGSVLCKDEVIFKSFSQYALF